MIHRPKRGIRLGTNKDKNRRGKGEGGKIDLNIPKIPNFDSRPAGNNGIGELPSQ